MITPAEFYRDPEVRERIAEYCGGTAAEPELCSAEYLVGYGEALVQKGVLEGYVSSPRSGFDGILDQGLDIFRSIWDRAATLSVLDVEWFNPDLSGDIYLRQAENFGKIEPLHALILEIYGEYGLHPLVIMTGQGYHYSFLVQRGTKADLMLEEAGRVPDTVEGKYRVRLGKRQRPVSLRHGKAFDGMGRVMEFLSHEIVRRAYGRSSLPVVITDTAVGRGPNGREAISVDLSCFGDPIFMRDIRCPFSTHQKHKVQRYKVGEAIAEGIPIQIALPRGRLKLEELFRLRRHYERAAEYARGVHGFIPDYTVNFKRLVAAYGKSRLFTFHRWFDGVEQDPCEKWPETYDLFDFREVPPCVRHCLREPNDNLLKPTNLQTLTRCLLALGWHPKHIAGLVRSKWERDYGWGDAFRFFDANSRASFYVRLFAGMVYDGTDGLMDHNCVSHGEKGCCCTPNCGYNLADYRPRF